MENNISIILKMMNLFVLLLLPLCARSFSRITSATTISESKPIIVGSTKPIENFDPLNLANNDEKTLLFREAELKHGRLAMISTITIPLIELNTHNPAIYEFSNLRPTLQIGLTSLMLVSEFSSMIRGWKNPFEKDTSSKYFKILENYQPGDLGFKVITDLDTPEGRELLNKELNNGRLAMIAALGMIVQELITQKTLF